MTHSTVYGEPLKTYEVSTTSHTFLTEETSSEEAEIVSHLYQTGEHEDGARIEEFRTGCIYPEMEEDPRVRIVYAPVYHINKRF